MVVSGSVLEINSTYACGLTLDLSTDKRIPPILHLLMASTLILQCSLLTRSAEYRTADFLSWRTQDERLLPRAIIKADMKLVSYFIGGHVE